MRGRIEGMSVPIYLAYSFLALALLGIRLSAWNRIGEKWRFRVRLAALVLVFMWALLFWFALKPIVTGE
jgi:hypothetical protein